MGDKIQIVSDGTVKGTTVKVNGIDMTKDYKVSNIYFNAHGGYKYKSNYSECCYTNPPRVSYDVSYLDGDKKKNIGVCTPSEDTEYGYLAQKDSLMYVGIEDDERLKEKLLDEFDKLRDKSNNIPKRILLENRTVESLSDKYSDIVNELELKSKTEKENKK